MYKFLTQTQFSHDRGILLYGNLAVAGLVLIYLILNFSASNSLNRYANGHESANAFVRPFVNTTPIPLAKGGEQQITFPEAGKYVVFATKLPQADYDMTIRSLDGKAIEVVPNDSIAPTSHEDLWGRTQWDNAHYTVLEVNIPAAGEYEVFSALTEDTQNNVVTEQVYLVFVRDVTLLNFISYWIEGVILAGVLIGVANWFYLRYYKQELKEERVLSDYRRGRLEQFMYEKE